MATEFQDANFGPYSHVKKWINERPVYHNGKNVILSDIPVGGIDNRSAFKIAMSRQTDHPLKFAVDAVERSFVDRSNQNELYSYMNWSDANLGASIGTKSGLVSNAYKGLVMDAGRELDDQELFLLTTGEKIAEELLDYRTLIYQATANAITFGNAVYLKSVKHGYPVLRSLPINYLTIVENMKQLYGMGQGRDFQVWEPNYYVLNEVMDSRLSNVMSNIMRLHHKDDPLPIVFDENQIIHIQVNKGDDQVDDSMNRWTYGVWSRAPLQRLVTTWWWKQEIMWADMLAREQTQPIQWHQVDLSWINEQTVNLPKGSTDSRMSHIIKQRRDYLNAYIQMQELRAPDSALVTDEHVKVQIVEPQAVTYLQSNDLLKQIDEAHTRAIGLPISETSTGSGSFATDVNRMSHSSVTTEHLINVVFKPLERYIKEILLGIYPLFKKEISRIRISRSTSLDKDKDMMMRRAAVAKELMIFTEDELRLIAGEEKRLTPNEKKERDKFYEKITSFGKEVGVQPGGKTGSNASTKKISSQTAGREPAKKQGPQANRPTTDNSKLQRQKTR
ncbi:hypothetical protein LCGC14_0267350 [marine sediment metagenome]|uniref:Portal protein n=1 Tax=marine sediment metagenome TaxID=412755 RepID=A0A0F9U4M9_9ZZZZ